MATPGNAQFRMAAHWPSASCYSFRITWAAGAPTITKDSAGFLSTTVTDGGSGKVTLTTREAWLEMYIVGCQIRNAPGHDDAAIVTAVVEGDTPSMVIETWDQSAGAYADLACVIDVTVMLVNTPANS
jgi:hypothetical protein